MKLRTFFSYAVATLALCSCSDNETYITPRLDNDVSEASSKRTVDEAISIAAKARKDFGLSQSRSSAGTDKYSVLAVHSKESRSGEQDTILYIVNFGDNEGYAIVSANAGTNDLLAVTESGTITNTDSIDNPGMNLYLSQAITYASSLGSGITINPISSVVTVRDTTFYGVDPRVEVKWGQRWPAGYFCSNGICGCVPLACVQAYSYFEQPIYLSLTYPDRDVDSDTLNWTSIKNIISRNAVVSSVNVISYGPEHFSLARLCREIGYEVGATYSASSTGVSSIGLLIDVIGNLTPELSTTTFTSGSPDPETELGNGIIVMQGLRNSSYGHAWIVDGYKVREITISTYNTISGTAFKILFDKTTTSTTYSHINWGWDGDSNGYFLMGVFDTSDPYELDPGATNTTAYNYGYSPAYFVINQ